MILKRFIINLFIDLKNKLFCMLDHDHVTCLTEIMEVLKTTLSKIEDIYYRHILFPKLINIKAKGHTVDLSNNPDL